MTTSQKIFHWLFVQWMTLGYSLHQKGWDIPKNVYSPVLNFLVNRASFETPESMESVPEEEKLRVPFEGDRVDPTMWSDDVLKHFIEFHMGLDTNEGRILRDLSAANQFAATGVDDLHTTLMAIAGLSAFVAGLDQLAAVSAANLAYYAATAGCVSDDDSVESMIERDLRAYCCHGVIETLQEAVAFIFYRLGLDHPGGDQYQSHLKLEWL